MIAYYNENDPKAAAWLRELIKQGHIAPGEVDERSIEDVRPDELARFAQCHFFAGIGIWSLALRMAGWPDGRPVWTGSCPCQPFSAAGKRAGFADERHLWPAFFHLIQHGKRPDIPVYGEQVASSDGIAWLDLVWADLEAAGHTVRPFVLCSAGVGAPLIRQRTYWVAISECGTTEPQRFHVGTTTDALETETSERKWIWSHLRSSGYDCHWFSKQWVDCRDGRVRPIEPGTFPLAHGNTEDVDLLRCYGNAISPQVAAAFIEASM